MLAPIKGEVVRLCVVASPVLRSGRTFRPCQSRGRRGARRHPYKRGVNNT